MSFLKTALGTLAGGLIGGAIVGSASASSDAAKDAANIQSDATNRAADLQYKQWQESNALQEPWRLAGQNALSQLRGMTDYTPFREAPTEVGFQEQAPEYRNFSARDFQADPGYAFRLSEGMKGLERSAAARGGLLSGATLKGIQRFVQDLGSQEYVNAFNRYQTEYGNRQQEFGNRFNRFQVERNARQQEYSNAFNRYQIERAARLQPLQSLAGVGQSTAQQMAQSGQTMAGQVSDMWTGGAAAQAAGRVGSANAWSNALNQGLNLGSNMMMLGRLG